MQKLLRLFFVYCCGAAAALMVQSSRGAGSDLGVIDTRASSGIPVQITGSPELVGPALKAFSVHGAFAVRTDRAPNELRFTTVSTNQVRVDVLQRGQPVLSQVVSGSSPRNALFRAADLAVKAEAKTNGFFASKLAFVSERTGGSEIYVSDLFLGEARQITHDKAFSLTPRWSPDGNRLLYTSYYKSGFPDVFLIDLGSLQRTTFISFKGTNSGARFSPNGSEVAMVLSGEGTPEIYVSNAQGRSVSRRTRAEGLVKSSPCFSPDGSQIVYASEPGPQLYVIPASGGSPRRVTSGISGYCAEPDWSRADPSKIVFTMKQPGGNYQIAVLDLKSGRSEQVSKAPVDAVEPAWLADGRHVVYTRRSAGSRSLWIVDTDTKKESPIGSIQAEKASIWGP